MKIPVTHRHLSLALLCLVDPVTNLTWAQEQGSDSVVLAEIVVTAQKREEALSDVPISMSAFTADDLVKHDIQRLQDFVVLTPSVAFDQNANGEVGAITIRGIGALGGEQNTFGYYIDGFEVGAAGSKLLNSGLADAERIEVLRGPQGTTFGRNVVAGGISVTMPVPEYEYTGSIDTEVSNYSGRELRGALNMPIVDGKAAARISSFYRHSDGNIDNHGPAGGSNDFDRWGVRGALLLEPTDQLTVNAALSYESFEQGLGNDVQDGILIGQIATLRQIIDSGFAPMPPGTLPAGTGRYYPQQRDAVMYDVAEQYDTESVLGTLRAEYDFGAVSLISVSGYVSAEQNFYTDLDESEYDMLINRWSDDETFYSTELRLQSNGDNWFDWIGGVYASRQHMTAIQDQSSGSQMELITALPGAITGLPFDLPLLPNDTRIIGGNFAESTDSYAFFFDGNIDVTSRLNFAAGVRYNHDAIEESVSNSVNVGSLPGGLLTVVSLPDDRQETSSEEVTWRSSLRYALTDTTNVYGTVSRGYRAGGVQLGNPSAPPDYDPETMTNYELGIKATLLDRRLALNAAVFRMEWKDIQIATVDRTNNATYTDNAAGAVAQGVELDATYLPLRGLDITLGASYLDTEIEEFIDATGLDRSGTVLPNTPEWRASLSAGYTMPIVGQWDGFVRGTYIYNDAQLEGLVDGQTNLQFIDAWERVDLRLGATTGRLRIEAYCENVFDETYATGIILSGFALTGASIVSPPRRFGLRVKLDF